MRRIPYEMPEKDVEGTAGLKRAPDRLSPADAANKHPMPFDNDCFHAYRNMQNRQAHDQRGYRHVKGCKKYYKDHRPEGE
jgi:hypothetical protein